MRIKVLAQGISKSHPVPPWELCPSIPGALAALGMSAFPGEPGQCPTPSGGGIFPEIQPKPPKSALCGSLDEFATFLTKAWNSKGEFAWVEGTRNQKCQKKSQKTTPLLKGSGLQTEQGLLCCQNYKICTKYGMGELDSTSQEKFYKRRKNPSPQA